ncbi:MAG: anti-sigma factor [Aquincola sp.]|nr:anti-sigma factor [Aquincola sp.]
MDYGKPDRADALGAQYVAGTLRGAARRRFEALLPGHPALRAAVQAWTERLMPLTSAVTPQQPPASVWQAIERRLFGGSAPAQAPAPLPLWRRLAPWRALSAAGALATLVLAVMLTQPSATQPPVLVVLQGTGGAAQGVNTFVASVSGDGRSLVTRALLPVDLQADRVLELWSVPPEGAPKSLGLIRADGSTVVPRERLPKGLLKGDTAALAVSLEPPGGSPTGTPTGPVLYAGKLQL